MPKIVGIIGGIGPESELPLLLRESRYEGLPVIDTMKAHVARAVAALFQ